MRFKLFLLLLIILELWLPPPTCAIISGNKYSLQLVPWIVYGEGSYEHTKNRFGATLIHPEVALTIGPIAKNLYDVTLHVGLAKLNRRRVTQLRIVGWARWNDHVGLLRVRRPFLLGGNVQLGSLATHFYQLTDYRQLLAAGWGQVNWYNTYPMDLHCTPVYASYEGGRDIDTRLFFLMTAQLGKDLSLGPNDIGGPVWDPESGEIVGLIYKWVFIKKKNRHSAVAVGVHRKWIATNLLSLLAVVDAPGNSTVY